MDDDFLINHDSGLTWMDVKINDYYVNYNSLGIRELLVMINGKRIEGDELLD